MATDIQITIANQIAYARVTAPAEAMADLEYEILCAQKQPAPQLADQLADQRLFESVERQIAHHLGLAPRAGFGQ